MQFSELLRTAELEVITFAIEFEIGGINDPCAGSPGNHFLRLSPADLEIIIEEASRVHWQAFPGLAYILDCEIRELDFLACPVLHTRSVGSVLFSMSAANRPQKN